MRWVADQAKSAQADDRLKEPCSEVVDIPDRDLMTAETARLWGQDRISLGDCGRKNRALVSTLEAIEGQSK